MRYMGSSFWLSVLRGLGPPHLLEQMWPIKPTKGYERLLYDAYERFICFVAESKEMKLESCSDDRTFCSLLL